MVPKHHEKPLAHKGIGGTIPLCARQVSQHGKPCCNLPGGKAPLEPSLKAVRDGSHVDFTDADMHMN